MARYYEETALIEFVKQYTPHINGETTMECVERAIREAPTADVVPKSEVAREIIDFIKGRIKAMEDHTPGENLDKAIGIVDWILSGVIDDLEKKYTEERENDKGKKTE